MFACIVILYWFMELYLEKNIRKGLNMSFIIYFLQQNIFLRNKRSKWLLCRCILRTVKKAYFPKSKHVRKTYKKRRKGNSQQKRNKDLVNQSESTIHSRMENLNFASELWYSLKTNYKVIMQCLEMMQTLSFHYWQGVKHYLDSL